MFCRYKLVSDHCSEHPPSTLHTTAGTFRALDNTRILTKKLVEDTFYNKNIVTPLSGPAYLAPYVKLNKMSFLRDFPSFLNFFFTRGPLKITDF